MNNKTQEANKNNETFDDNENVQLYHGLELDDYPARGQMVFIAAVMFFSQPFLCYSFHQDSIGLHDIHAARRHYGCCVVFRCCLRSQK